jgi:hypothetical protein
MLNRLIEGQWLSCVLSFLEGDDAAIVVKQNCASNWLIMVKHMQGQSLRVKRVWPVKMESSSSDVFDGSKFRAFLKV